MEAPRVKASLVVAIALMSGSLVSFAFLGERDARASTPAFGPNVLVDDSLAATSSPRIAVDGNEDLHVVWMDQRNLNTDLYYSKSTDQGTTWSPAVRIDNAPGTTASLLPDIAVNRSGTEVYVVYHDNRGGSQDIWLARSLDGGTTWNPSVRVDDWLVGSGTSQTARVAVDDAGAVYAIFTDWRNSTSPYQMFFAKSTNEGSSFGPNIQLSTVASGSFTWAPDIATEGTGQVYAAWTDATTSESVRVAASSNSGTTWSTATVQTGSPGMLMRGASLATRTGGRVSVAYPSSAGAVRYSESVDFGATWTTPLQVDDAAAGVNRQSPSLSTFLGTPWVVWADDRFGTYDIFASGSQNGVDWGDCPSPCNPQDDPMVNEVMMGDASGPASAGSLFGLYAVWHDGRTSPTNIYFARYVYSEVWITEFRDAPLGQEVVEIVNFGGLDTDFTGWTLIVDGFGYGLGPLGTVPGGTVGGEYRRIGNSASDDLYDPTFSLGVEGGIIELRDASNTLVDRVGYGQSGVAPDPIPTMSTARHYDGSTYVDEWSFDQTPTIGSLNNGGRVIADPELVLNEVYRHAPMDADRFVEMYYRGSTSLNTTGYRLLGDALYTITALTGRDVWPANQLTMLGNTPLSILLNNLALAGDNVYLLDPNGNLLDEVGWTTAVNTGSSVCRDPDGAGDWDGYDDPTSTASGWVVGPAGCVPSPPLIALGPSPQDKRADFGEVVRFPLTVTNKQLAPDYLDLTSTNTPNGWTVEFYDATDTVALTPTPADGDGIIDTGQLGTEQRVDITVRVTVPWIAPVSDIEFVNVTATASISAAYRVARLRVILNPFLTTNASIAPNWVNVLGTGFSETATLTLEATARGLPFGTPNVYDIVLMIDSSGSMRSNDPSDLRKSESQNFISNNLTARAMGDRISILDFDTDCIWTGPDHHIDSPGHDGVPTYADPVNDINSIDSSGGTNLVCAVADANTELITRGDPLHQWIEILITDGDGGNPIPEAQAAAAAGITIFTIGLIGSGGVNEQLLIDIATITNGTYYPAADPSAFAGIFSQIASNFSSIAARNPWNNYSIPMVRELLQPYILADAFSYVLGPNNQVGIDPFPECVPQPTCWTGPNLPWNLSIIQVNQTWSVSFDIRCTSPGIHDVQVIPPSGVTYLNWNWSRLDLAFPQVSIDCRVVIPPPILPVRNVTTEWNPLPNSVTVSWSPPPTLPDHYLIYRATSSRGFTSFAPAAAVMTVYPPATSWSELLSGSGERYYIVRSSNAAGDVLSETSNTAGVFFGMLSPGITTLSTPLEYFPWVDYSGPLFDTVGEFRVAINLPYVEYLDAGGSWVRVSGASAEPFAVGRGYVVSVAVARPFAFTGLPGAMIRHDELPGPSYTPATDALGLTLTVNGDSLDLTLPALAGADSYEVWFSSSRAGFFDGSAQLVGGVAWVATAGTHVNALLLGPEVCYLVVPSSSSSGTGASSYSLCARVEMYQGAESIGLPLHPDLVRSLDWFCSAIPRALGMIWLSGVVWVPHFTAMPAGTYDANVLVGRGYQLTVAGGPARYVHIGW